MEKCDSTCPVHATLDVIGGKWKLLILWYLHGRILRYSELQKLIGDITPKMLAQELRALERDGIIVRKVYPVVPPKVEYAISAYGKTLHPMIHLLGEWGEKHLLRTARRTKGQSIIISTPGLRRKNARRIIASRA